MTKENVGNEKKVLTALEKRNQLLNNKKNAFAKNNASSNKFLNAKSAPKQFKHVRKK